MIVMPAKAGWEMKIIGQANILTGLSIARGKQQMMVASAGTLYHNK